MPISFYEKLTAEIAKKRTSFCLGLDVDPEKIPSGFSKDAQGVEQFCKEVIHISYRFVAAYKFNMAFYEVMGASGWAVLERCAEYASGKAVLIADGKRGDIGNTARFYARSVFRNLPFDACTVNPYMGEDTITPFLEYEGKGIYLLCVTSNPSGGSIQLLGKEPAVYERVAEFANRFGPHHVGLVTGATRPEFVVSLDERNPEISFLVPGIGSQGGDAGVISDLCKHRKHHLVNVSRAALFPQTGIFPDNIYESVESLSKRFNV